MLLSRIAHPSWLLCALFTLSLGTSAPCVQAAPKPATSRLDPKKNTDFIVSLTKDASGAVWFGTEDSGIWRRDGAGKWTQFTTKDGLGDNNAYCLSVDRLGRLWAGHLNHGVSVWNGAKWQNYGVLEGPLGERVFAIAVSPVEGDVWMATNAGLTRYSSKTGAWKHYTRADGLPSNQLSALSIDSIGNIYVGTSAKAWASATWKAITGSGTSCAAPKTPAPTSFPPRPPVRACLPTSSTTF